MRQRKLTDASYLRHEYYNDPGAFDSRVVLQERFSTNKRGWHPWVFDHLDVGRMKRVLEVGAGPGYLWRRNVSRLPATDIIVSDLSEAMVREAQQALAVACPRLRFAVLDVQHTPFRSGIFDLVVANHMLYHARDLMKAFWELARVLKPGGKLVATTTGPGHLRELRELILDFKAGAHRSGPSVETHFNELGFNLQNGERLLSAHFCGVTLKRYPDSLVVNEAPPLVSWVRSLLTRPIPDHELADFGEFLEAKLAAEGPIYVTKEIGLFLADRC